MTVYTTLPTDDENLEVTVVDDPDLVTININPAQVTGSGGTTGTVERVDTGTGLTGGPITTTGTISIDETSDITFNSVTATDEFIGDIDGAVATTIRNTSGGTIYKGQAVYVTGLSGNTPTVSLANASSASHMPAVGIVRDTSINNNASGQIITLGNLQGIDTSASNQIETGITLAVGDVLYVSASEAGNVTNVQPTGEGNLVQNLGTVIRVDPNTNMTYSVKGAGRTNATPNLNDGNIFIGDSNNQAVTSSLDTEVSALGYIKTETDNQTLSFSTPDLTISNGNTVDLTSLKYTDADVDLHLNSNIANNNEVLTWRTNDWDWTTLADVATSNDYNDLDNRPTLTTINNNADNRIITGSGTAETLNGEADFTWDGTNAIIDGTASSLTTPVLSLVTDNSSWNTPQLMCTDSNGKVFSQVGQLNTGASSYVWNITLDPDNTHGRTGVTSYAGDYYVDFRKEYDDQSAIKITQNIFGANGGYIMRVKDDFNSNSPRYDFKPMTVQAEEFRVEARDGVRTTDLVLTVDIDKAKFEVPIGHVQLSSDPSSPEGGWTYYNTTTDKLRLYVAGSTNAWVDLN